MNLLFLFLGGGLGALSRYGIFFLLRHFEHEHIRLGVFMVNILGSFAIGMALAAFLKSGLLPRGSAIHLFFITGFLGAFTTFSTFAQDNLELLLLEKNFLGFLINSGVNFFGAMIAVFAGYFLIIKILS